MTNVLYTTEGILRVNKRMNTERSPNGNRNVGKCWWRNVYFNWDNEQFKYQHLDSQRTISTSS